MAENMGTPYSEPLDADKKQHDVVPESVGGKYREFKVANASDHIVGVACAADRELKTGCLGIKKIGLEVEGCGFTLAFRETEHQLVPDLPVSKVDAHR